MTPIGAEQQFDSSLAAAEALDIDSGSLSSIFRGKTKTVANSKGERFTGRRERNDTDLPNEEWKHACATVLVSNRGRIQTKHPSGDNWGPKRFPENSNKQGYLVVKVKGGRPCVHALVGELFFIGPRPRNWAVWDHITPGDKHNNDICNIHPVTREHNGVNTAQHRDFFLWPVGKFEERFRCTSQSATARVYDMKLANLNSVLHKRTRPCGSVITTVCGYCAAFCDEVE